MNISDWKITGSKTVYSNKRIKLLEHEVVRPDGSKTIYIVLEQSGPFAVVIPLTEDNYTYIVGQYRVPIRSFSWEFPMGGVKNVKIAKDIAKQELREEVGLTAKEWNQIGWFHIAGGHTSQKGYVFIAKNLTQKAPHPEPGEFLRIKKVPIKKVGEMIQHGEIKDAPTIVAYHFYITFKHKNI